MRAGRSRPHRPTHRLGGEVRERALSASGLEGTSLETHLASAQQRVQRLGVDERRVRPCRATRPRAAERTRPGGASARTSREVRSAGTPRRSCRRPRWSRRRGVRGSSRPARRTTGRPGMATRLPRSPSMATATRARPSRRMPASTVVDALPERRPGHEDDVGAERERAVVGVLAVPVVQVRARGHAGGDRVGERVPGPAHDRDVHVAGPLHAARPQQPVGQHLGRVPWS